MRPAFTGRAAALRWGYRAAARLGEWSITVDRPEPGEAPRPTLRYLAAAVVDADPLALTQTPLELVVPVAGRDRELRWPVVPGTVAHVGAALRAQLGPKLKG